MYEQKYPDILLLISGNSIVKPLCYYGAYGAFTRRCTFYFEGNCVKFILFVNPCRVLIVILELAFYENKNIS